MVAIMGVMAAVAVPMVNNQLGNTKSTGSPDTWTQTIQVDSSGNPVLDSNGQQIVTGA